MKKILLLSTMLLLMSPIATAQSIPTHVSKPHPKNYKSAQQFYKEGKGYLDRNDDAKAFPLLKRSAEMGNPFAQYDLGLMYEYSSGLENHEEALKWFGESIPAIRRLAEKGNVEAQKKLGDIYYYGDAVEKDLSEAAKWTLKAAEQGDPEAQCGIGTMYINGEGVDQNYPEGIKWLNKGADQGNPQAQYLLGDLYLHGEGVNKDVTEGLKWIRQAAAQGDQEAASLLKEFSPEEYKKLNLKKLNEDE